MSKITSNFVSIFSKKMFPAVNLHFFHDLGRFHDFPMDFPWNFPRRQRLAQRLFPRRLARCLQRREERGADAAGSGGTGRPGRRSRGFFGEEMGDLWGFIWIGCWGYLVGGDWNHGVL